MEEIKARVAAEMARRHVSGRQIERDLAAKGVAMSATSLFGWLNGNDKLGNAVRHGVAAAFDWPVDWPEYLPPEPLPAEVVSQLDRIEAQQREQGAQLREVVRLLTDAVNVLAPDRDANAGGRSAAKSRR